MGLRGRQWLIAGLVAVLAVGIFLFDILTPRGLTNQVLYVIPLLISFLSPVVAFPLVVASVCSLLTIAGLFLSPDVFNIPPWVVVSNRIFSLVIIWTPVLFFHQRRRHEDQLTRNERGSGAPRAGTHQGFGVGQQSAGGGSVRTDAHGTHARREPP